MQESGTEITTVGWKIEYGGKEPRRERMMEAKQEVFNPPHGASITSSLSQLASLQSATNKSRWKL